jgi:hypothetical protein
VFLRSGIGDVCGEYVDWLFVRPIPSALFTADEEGEGTYNDIVSGSIRPIFKVQPNQMFRQSPIAHLIHSIQNEVEQVKSRNQSRWKIDICRNR